MNLKLCTKEEFYEFIKNYPKTGLLRSRLVTLCDPPCTEFSDLTLGDYPENIVAAYMTNDPRKNEGDYDFRILAVSNGVN